MKSIAFYFFIIIIIASACAGDPPLGHARAIGYSSTKVLLQSSENLYVRLNNSKERGLVANEPNKAKADTFNLCDLGNDVIALQAMSGYYVTIHPSHNNNAIIRQKYIFDSEKIKRTPTKDGVILQTFTNGVYLRPDPSQNKLLSGIATLNKSCTLKIIELP